MTGNLLSNTPIWLNALIVLVTMLLIAKGAQWVVVSASQLAKLLGLSELVIGLTVVAMGTSAPEFAVTLIAGLKGHGNISVGNIVGSNIFNLGFILGGCALVKAIPTSSKLVWRDGMVLFAATVFLTIVVGLDLHLGRLEGAIMFTGLVLYIIYLLYQRDDSLSSEAVLSVANHPLFKQCLMLGGGLILILASSHLMVDAAASIAADFGVSEWVIAVTIVAAGTSAPEIATSLTGVIKGHYSLSAGNIIGSDLFNLLGVLGLAGMLQPVTTDPMARISLLAVTAMVLVTVFFMRTGWRISRLEGALLVFFGLMRWGFDFTARV
ncbi:calcium/sodium antiporter [Spartinivicinus poritis]|uniref:Calcium/sodium antiporter n=1 Tax=Spartinivicinus poritis TaxID=2994640 RepID=A0ABT5U365_9GAMM|nr:calcium/sodium antiporter [Spartinivicinus sp. A2-2]MDE1460808.1 calcium/sodium antiporter [Spartinivicinus sp. A2-2]